MNFHVFHAVICCQYQGILGRRMLLLSSLTLLLKALTSSMILPLQRVVENHPVDLKWIYTQQNTGIDLATKASKYPDCYFNKLMHSCVVVCFSLPSNNHLKKLKITLRKEMIIPLIWQLTVMYDNTSSILPSIH